MGNTKIRHKLELFDNIYAQNLWNPSDIPLTIKTLSKESVLTKTRILKIIRNFEKNKLIRLKTIKNILYVFKTKRGKETYEYLQLLKEDDI